MFSSRRINGSGAMGQDLTTQIGPMESLTTGRVTRIAFKWILEVKEHSVSCRCWAITSTFYWCWCCLVVLTSLIGLCSIHLLPFLFVYWQMRRPGMTWAAWLNVHLFVPSEPDPFTGSEASGAPWLGKRGCKLSNTSDCISHLYFSFLSL